MEKFTYLVLTTGGHGADIWQKETEVEAEDIAKAAALAMEEAQRLNGWVVSIDQLY